jgi:hypothetical protein
MAAPQDGGAVEIRRVLRDSTPIQIKNEGVR